MWRRLLMPATLVAIAAVVAVVAVVAANRGGSVSAAEYQTTVVEARNRVDAALARIATPTSKEDLFNRIDDAGGVINSAARNLSEVNVDGELGKQNDELVRTLKAFSEELKGTAATFRDPAFAATTDSIKALSFPEWDKVNAIFGRLRDQGVGVQPLGRH